MITKANYESQYTFPSTENFRFPSALFPTPTLPTTAFVLPVTYPPVCGIYHAAISRIQKCTHTQISIPPILNPCPTIAFLSTTSLSAHLYCTVTEIPQMWISVTLKI